jgi:hypothetical protein
MQKVRVVIETGSADAATELFKRTPSLVVRGRSPKGQCTHGAELRLIFHCDASRINLANMADDTARAVSEQLGVALAKGAVIARIV